MFSCFPYTINLSFHMGCKAAQTRSKGAHKFRFLSAIWRERCRISSSFHDDFWAQQIDAIEENGWNFILVSALSVLTHVFSPGPVGTRKHSFRQSRLAIFRNKRCIFLRHCGAIPKVRRCRRNVAMCSEQTKCPNELLHVLIGKTEKILENKQLDWRRFRVKHSCAFDLRCRKVS